MRHLVDQTCTFALLFGGWEGEGGLGCCARVNHDIRDWSLILITGRGGGGGGGGLKMGKSQVLPPPPLKTG